MMKSRSIILIVILTSFWLIQKCWSQRPALFRDDQVAEIHITLAPDSLIQLLAPGNEESDHEYPARFSFRNGVLHDSAAMVGFRLRGNTSRYAQKKSFKVSFNTFSPGQKFNGVEKLNINGEHNDPSIIRAKLSWDLFHSMQVPASQAFHAKFYINNSYFGLYICVEHVDENFVKDRFGTNSGNLYKCLWPADLTYINSNPDSYKFGNGSRRTYDLITNKETDDYSDLEELISVLHFTPAAQFESVIQQFFNVDQFLRVLAVDAVVGSWDDYWFLKNNYYLYHNPETDQFEFIPYDYDNTFGIWWDGILGGTDWGTRNLYTWGHPTEDRPLVERILDVLEFRNRYSFYISHLLNSGFHPDTLFPKIDAIHSMITQAAEEDVYRTLDYGFSILNFHNSYTQKLGGHVTYGLKPYITTRRNSALTQLKLKNIAPVIRSLSYEPRAPQVSDAILFQVQIFDDHQVQSAYLHYTMNNSWQPLNLYDDGLHFDREAGDQIYANILPARNQDGLLNYYITAVDDSATLSFLPAGAPGIFFEIRIGYETVPLFINEFLAQNNTSLGDEHGDNDDWVEIYNGGIQGISLQGFYLSDDFTAPDKWALPDTMLQPGGFLLIWTDDEEETEGPLHASFKLNKDGERIGIFNHDSTNFAPVDTISYGNQSDDISYGRSKDGEIPWNFFTQPTPGLSNNVTGIQLVGTTNSTRSYRIYPNYPNPFNPVTTIRLELYRPGRLKIGIYEVTGQLIRILYDQDSRAGSLHLSWEGMDQRGKMVSSGVYFVRSQLITDDQNTLQMPVQKIILLR